MKIKSLEIYGYGQLMSRKIKFDQSFMQIYGENEAGKSTIQAFIHSILFGFPTKKENEPRLEPRLGNQYGGKLVLDFDGQIVEVERVKGRVTGDVKVYLSNGKVKDEEWLKQKLNFINKRTYQGIFSFNVLGLQDIHKNLTEDQLQMYLLQAGALGSTEFTGMNDLMQVEKDALYKKNGKNPVLNVQLEQLNDLEIKIKNEEKKLSEYERLQDERDKTSRRLNQLKENLGKLTDRLTSKEKEISLHNEVVEWKKLESNLNIEPYEFPEQGIERYESAVRSNESIKRDLTLRNEKLGQVVHTLENVKVMSERDEKALNSIRQRESDIKEKHQELKQLNQQIDNAERDNELLRQDIGWNEEFLDVDTSDAMKTHIAEVNRIREENVAEREQIKRSLNQLSIEQERYSNNVDKLHNDLVSDENYEQKKVYNQKALELGEKKSLYKKMEESFNKQKEESEKRSKQYRLASGIGGILLIAIAIYAFIASQIVFSAIFAVVGVVLVGLAFMIKSKELNHDQAFSKEIDELEEKVQHLKQFYDLDFNLDEQTKIRQELESYYQSQEILSTKQSELNKELEQVEEIIETKERALKETKVSLHVSNQISSQLLNDALSTIRKIKQNRLEITRITKIRDEKQAALEAFYREADSIVSHAGLHYQEISLFHDVKQALDEHQKEFNIQSRNNDQQALLTNEINALNERLEENNNVIQSLFDFISVDNEEAYYRHHKAYVSYHEDLKRFNYLTDLLNNQNYDYDKNTQLSYMTKTDLENERTQLEGQVDEYNDRYLNVQAELSDLNAQINHMETDETLSALRHEYHLLKDKVNETANDWAALSYLQNLVEAHIKQIKDKRLPYVVKDATDILKALTEGRYNQVIYEEQNVQVKHENGQIFHPTELSQSTKELLYIALRFSLIKSLQKYYPFPIIVDDAFVHFDKHRKEIMIKYLMSMKDDIQILYFTCNKDQNVPQKQTITLTKIEGAKSK
ncbi:AAA family ATPase [Mammaliicoccus sciuri]|uniref:ATP-binding protein n=1 Tax=Mammaliicoccus sciuri TaxID=1296 RepID=UPI001C62F83C|nr:AAA family ATPase [Mammaliicoccus sciuri]MCD8797706.1 AAA family ATPase [Mammaliicoccus sciuri]QYG30284.1 AAA family ATPase [Mammaliicoccus sciuri]